MLPTMVALGLVMLYVPAYLASVQPGSIIQQKTPADPDTARMPAPEKQSDTEPQPTTP